MSAKSQELISKLLAAEDEAEKIIKSARDLRSQKMKEVKQAADDELAPFRMKEEQKYAEDLRALAAKGDVSGDLEKATKSELMMVRNDFESNKKAGADFILNKVLTVDLTIPAHIKAALTA